jgi:hypothetical protein
LYGQYISHDEATFSYKEEALHCFHTFKDVFLLGRAGNKAQAKANAFRTEHLNKQNVDDETNAKSWTRSKTRHEINS